MFTTLNFTTCVYVYGVPQGTLYFIEALFYRNPTEVWLFQWDITKPLLLFVIMDTCHVLYFVASTVRINLRFLVNSREQHFGKRYVAVPYLRIVELRSTLLQVQQRSRIPEIEFSSTTSIFVEYTGHKEDTCTNICFIIIITSYHL